MTKERANAYEKTDWSKRARIEEEPMCKERAKD